MQKSSYWLQNFVLHLVPMCYGITLDVQNYPSLQNHPYQLVFHLIWASEALFLFLWFYFLFLFIYLFVFPVLLDTIKFGTLFFLVLERMNLLKYVSVNLVATSSSPFLVPVLTKIIRLSLWNHSHKTAWGVTQVQRTMRKIYPCYSFLAQVVKGWEGFVGGSRFKSQ